MKRWRCWLFFAVGVVFLLWIALRPVSPCLHPPVAGDRSVVSQNEFVSTWCRALRVASPAYPRNRAGPRESFATHPVFITDEDGPPWLDYRGPPGPNGCSQDLVTSSKAAGQAGSLGRNLFRQNSARTQNRRFCNSL